MEVCGKGATRIRRWLTTVVGFLRSMASIVLQDTAFRLFVDHCVAAHTLTLMAGVGVEVCAY